MTRFLAFLPLVFWAAYAFAALYSVIETRFRPLPVLAAGAVTAARILWGHWRIAAALLAVFATGPIAELALVGLLELTGQALLVSALAFEVTTAALVALIATFIHERALPPPERSQAERRLYQIESAAMGAALFLITTAVSLALSFAVLRLGVPPQFRPDFFVRATTTLAFVPLALIRPGLSLGLGAPVRAAFRAVARSPIAMGVWVIALGLPGLAFQWLSAQIYLAHGVSLWTSLAFNAANIVFNAANCAFFETTTLLLLARAEGRFSLPGDKRRRQPSSG